MKKIGAIFLSFFIFSFLNINKALAADTIGVSISPPTFELTANRGDSLENTIKLSNTSEVPIEVTVSSKNFTAVGEDGSVGLTEDNTTYSLAKWISIIPDRAIIPAKTSKIFLFKTDVPQNAEAGGHFGSVVFQLSAVGNGESGASVAQEIASLVLLRISGTIDEKVTVLEFTTDSKFYEYGNVTFLNRIKNEGSVHDKPKGSITITNMFGKQVDVLVVDGKNVLPGAIRKNEVVWNKKWAIGRYTATEVLSYGANNQQLIDTTNFIVLPYKQVGGGLLFVTIFVVVLYKGRKRIKLAISVLFEKNSN